MKPETAQEALDNHPTATKAHVNTDGEWHFSTPPTDFKTVETLTKGEVKVVKEPKEEVKKVVKEPKK